MAVYFCPLFYVSTFFFFFFPQFCQEFTSHPWLPSFLNSLLWWTKCHNYKSLCFNSSTISGDLTLRSCTWALRASIYLTSLICTKCGHVPCGYMFGDGGVKCASSPNLTKCTDLLKRLNAVQMLCWRVLVNAPEGKYWASFCLYQSVPSTEQYRNKCGFCLFVCFSGGNCCFVCSLYSYKSLQPTFYIFTGYFTLSLIVKRTVFLIFNVILLHVFHLPEKLQNLFSIRVI